MRSRWLALAAQRPLACGMASSGLLYLSLPPVGWSWLAWIAPLGWLIQVRDGTATGWRFYLTQWLAACSLYLAFLHGIRLAHPALYVGWVALSAYLAIYPPLFIGLTRWATRRANCPLIVAAPLIWMSGELLRGYLLTGFTGGMLSHGLAFWTQMIQIVDIGGAYLLSGLVMLVATALLVVLRAAGLETRGQATDGGNDGGNETENDLVSDGVSDGAKVSSGVGGVLERPLVTGLLGSGAVLAALAYGQYRLAERPAPGDASGGTAAVASGNVAAAALPPLQVALIQNSIDTVFDYNEERNRRIFELYRQQTLDVCRAHPELDVIIWPESMFTENSPEFLVEDRQLRARIADRLRAFDSKVGLLARELAELRGGRGVHLVVGTITIDATDTGRRPREYNSALLIDPAGRVVDRYYKRHLVMFGEYIPLGETFPAFYQWAGMSGASPGAGPASFAVKGRKLCPNICFETMVPHVIGTQLRDLRKSREVADILINLTNDGWFWGSTILDMHFQAGIFRAIEARRPLVVAANTGITAWIDGSGRVLGQLPRRQPGVLMARVELDGRESWYASWGDWPLTGLVICGYGWLMWRRRQAARRSPQTTQTAQITKINEC